jgi:co-chaperonin GroES (HSP10)
MKFKPLGHTVLVEPDLPPQTTDSGTIILPEDHFFIPTSGTVVAVGKGSKREWGVKQKAYRRVLSVLDGARLATSEEAQRVRDEANALLDQPEPTPSISVGERVVFAAQAGLTIQDEDGKEYILLDEDRIAIIVEEEVA